MRKLHRLKEWYSLEDAAVRLTMTLEEPVSVNDILQMTVEGHIPLSWYTRHVPARRVAPVSKVFEWDPDLMKARKMFDKDCELKSEHRTIMLSLEPQTELIEHLDGPYKLDYELSGVIKDWVLSLITGTGGELICLEGYFVSDAEDNIWQIMEMFDSETLNYKRLHMTAERRAADLKKPIDHPDNYFPSGGSPEPSELGITKTDLEAFEIKLCNSTTAQPEKPLNAKERSSLLKLILGMAIDGYGYDHKASRSPIAREIASNLITHGIHLDEDTVRKWLNQAKEEHAPEVAA